LQEVKQCDKHMSPFPKYVDVRLQTSRQEFKKRPRAVLAYTNK